jgi:hypothetical protein
MLIRSDEVFILIIFGVLMIGGCYAYYKIMRHFCD